MKIPRQMLVAIMVAVLVAVVFFMFVLKPKMAQISDTRDKVATAKADGDTLRAQIAKLEDIRAHQPDLRARLDAVSGYLPSTPDLPDFIRQVQAAATKAGIDLQSIAPSPPSSVPGTTGIDQVNVTLAVTGDFFRLQDFLARVENLRRIVEVASVSVSPQVDPLTNNTTLSSTLALHMFVVQQNGRIGKPATAAASPRPSSSP